jgi:hypothetical protein
MSVSKYTILLFAVVLLTAACQRKNCPTYWANSGTTGMGQTASDGKKGAAENLNTTEEGSREQEFPLVRVKRDKNGIITKKAMSRNKVKRTDPRKSYKPR